MPQSSQLLYFHLSMRADDEGFVNNPRSIMRNVGCKDDDLKILAAKKFIIPFDSGIVVIKHWKIHNYIRGDRIRATKCKQEKALLSEDENKSYTICQSCVSQLSGSCPTEVRLGKDRLGKDSISSVHSDKLKETFDTFWNEYPKKQSKDYARSVWKKVAITDEIAQSIIEGLKKSKKGDHRFLGDAQYIPMPASWLNARGWEDKFDGQAKRATQEYGIML